MKYTLEVHKYIYKRKINLHNTHTRARAHTHIHTHRGGALSPAQKFYRIRTDSSISTSVKFLHIFKSLCRDIKTSVSEENISRFKPSPTIYNEILGNTLYRQTDRQTEKKRMSDFFNQSNE